MKIAALYDIHGNLPALKAILDKLKTVNIHQIIIGGDVILGPLSKECLDLLLKYPLPISFIQGNCEVAVLSEMEGHLKENFPKYVLNDIRWTAQQLTTEHQMIMSNWPKTIILETPKLGKILFCHATPRSDNEFFTYLTAEDKLLPLFENLGVDMVVCGHTHIQFDRMVGKVRVVNAGSVGMPYGKAGAYWLLLDDEVELRYTAYDLEAAADQILQLDYPNAENFAKNCVLQPQAKEAMLELFKKAELLG